MNRYYLGVLLIIFSAVGFGLMPIFALAAYRGAVNIPTLLFLRFTASAVLLFLCLFAGGGGISVKWRQLIALFVMGGIFYALQSTFYFYALKHLSVSLTAILLYTYPILVALLSLAVERERLTVRVALAIPLCFAGLALALGVSLDRIDLLGVLLAFGAAFIYSCYIITGNRLVRQVPCLTTSAFVALFAALSFLVAGLSQGSLSFDFSAGAWLPITGIVICSTVLAILAFFKGLELIGSTSASVLSMFEPIVTIGLCVAFLEERLSAGQILGVAAVLGGSLLVILGGRQRGTGAAAIGGATRSSREVNTNTPEAN